jgi:hypothetical protein
MYELHEFAFETLKQGPFIHFQLSLSSDIFLCDKHQGKVHEIIREIISLQELREIYFEECRLPTWDSLEVVTIFRKNVSNVDYVLYL